MKTVPDRGLSVARAGIFVVIPLAFWVPFQDCFPLPKLLALVLLAGAAAVPGFSRPCSPSFAWAAAWAAWPACLLLVKQVPVWRSGPEAFLLGLPVLAAAASRGRREEAEKGAVFLAATAVLMSAYGLLQAGGTDLGSWISPFHKGVASTIGNPDLFGGFLILPLALSLSLAAGRRSPWWALSSAVIGAAVVSTESRSAWLGAALAAAVVLGRTKTRAAAAGLAAGLLLGAAWLAAHPAAVERAFSKGALTERVWTWKQACRAAVASPVTGRGPASFRTAYLAAQTASRGGGEEFYHYTEYAHCEPLHFLLELGVIGLGLWLWCLACFIKMLGSSPARKGSPELWTGAAAAWAGLVPAALLSFPFHVPATAAPLLLLTAMLSARGREARCGRFSAAFGFVILSALAWTARAAVVSAGLREGSVAAAAGRQGEAAYEFRRLSAVTQGDARIFWNLAAALRAAGRPEEAVAAARKASALEPDFYEIHHELGMELKALGKPLEAETEYRRAVLINPGFAPSFNNLGNLLGEMGRLREAEAAQRRAVELSPDFVQARRNLAVTLIRLGKHSEAQRVLDGGSR